MTMTCIFDSCTSGSILELPYGFKCDGKQKQMEYDKDFEFPHWEFIEDHKSSKGWKENIPTVTVVAGMVLGLAFAIP